MKTLTKSLQNTPLSHKLFVLIILFAGTLLCSCRVRSGVYYSDGMTVTDKSRCFPRWSTTYTARGKKIYTDSITGTRVMIVKYRTKNSCWSQDRKRLIEITFDSTGKRTGRENVLRTQRKQHREKYDCDTCKYTRRRVRTTF